MALASAFPTANVRYESNLTVLRTTTRYCTKSAANRFKRAPEAISDNPVTGDRSVDGLLGHDSYLVWRLMRATSS